MAIKNPNVEVIDEYVNTNTKILHHCKAHNVYWKIKPLSVLHGCGCEICKKEKFHDTKTKTHEQYVKEVEQINPNIIVKGKYIDARTPTKHYCKKHDIFWNPLPMNVLKGNGCIECGKEKIGDKNRKSHERYIKELISVNPYIDVIDTYIDACTPILHKCLIDNYEWKATPANILSGHGCPKCAGNIKRTQEKYIEEIKKINSDIEVLGEYISANIRILHKCKKHNIQWMVSPRSILQGCGCVECGKEKLHILKVMTHNQYVEKLRNVNSDIVVIGKYNNSQTPILHKCLIDGYKWYAKPANILSGHSCPQCVGNIKRTQKEYIDEIGAINPNIEVLGEYISANVPILHKCKKHNIQWMVSPRSILQGCGCIECGKEKIGDKNRKSHDQYVKELKEINSNIKVLGTYISANIPILHKCLIDGYEWLAIPSNLLSKHGCPKCNDSKGEKEISLWLDNKHIVYERQKRFINCRDIRSLPFDFYLPKYNSCIEYDGEQHFKSIKHFGGEEAFKRRIKHDSIKDEYCKNNGISLLRIPYNKNAEEELNNFLFI